MSNSLETLVRLAQDVGAFVYSARIITPDGITIEYVRAISKDDFDLKNSSIVRYYAEDSLQVLQKKFERLA